MAQYHQPRNVRAAHIQTPRDPEPVCARCPRLIGGRDSTTLCDDCRVVLSWRPSGQKRRGAHRPDPGFEITLHDLRADLHQSPTKIAINEAGYPVIESAMDEDPTAHHAPTHPHTPGTVRERRRMKLIYREVANCGTYGGYQTHKKIGEEPCPPCIEARNTYIREYRRRKGHTKATLMPINTTCPNCGHHITAGAA